ncbi:DUF747-domain-containing protein [Microstroma glucosiphilum]|uniref:DUF747-domain-containing protein n=1 Tax=Pseudomicrostroma glucosiphilum TaxID=1684307 RepID=A0A316U075_9BASI|nr:DUF747-domain-containing protein [Pseudomicrostroma glucosiphilum]PWN17893.1 DUF747-domain-containing protein [Pseudomicrostroma glucosiphilum]
MARQDHRPSSQTPSTPKSSRATLPKDGGTDSAHLAPFSLWEYLKEEVLATDVDSTQEMRWDRVSNFMAVPWQCEKMILFGFVICLDSFLYTFTILPLRFAVAATLWCRNLLHNVTRPSATPHVSLHSSHKCDIIKTALIVVSCYILSQVTDASKMYHSVRGQDTIKLYVIFNVLEIVDRLCCSLGQDLLDALFSRRTLGRQSDGRQPLIRPLHLFVLALIYIQIHTIVLFYQLVTLNVAINSYDNALLTLLLSNQFVEIKGSVFKKFEKENLFQMTCADIVERFQLTLILFAIGVRNLIEVTSGGDNLSSVASRPRGGPLGDVPLPRSFTVLPSLSVLATSFAPVVIVLGSECVVDWLKHAFITKFNHIRPSVYGRFMDVLCRDLVIAGPAQNTFVDQSPILSRRLGFAALPLACLLARVLVQIYGMLGDDSHYDECAIPSSAGQTSSGAYDYVVALMRNVLRGKISALSFSPSTSLQALALLLPVILCWVFLVALKVLLGTALISFAHHRYSTMSAREVEEELNDRTRPHIGVNSLEAAYEDKVKQVLSGADGAKASGRPKNGPGTGSNLLDVNRYTMVKSRLY